MKINSSPILFKNTEKQKLDENTSLVEYKDESSSGMTCPSCGDYNELTDEELAEEVKNGARKAYECRYVF